MMQLHNFEEAVNQLSMSVAVNSPMRKSGGRHIAQVSQNGDDGGSYNSGPYKTHCNGVEITDTNWRGGFSRSDWRKLPFIIQNMIGYCKRKEDFLAAKREVKRARRQGPKATNTR